MTVQELKTLIRVWGAHAAKNWYSDAETEVDEAIKLVDKLVEELKIAVCDSVIAEHELAHDEGPDAA